MAQWLVKLLPNSFRMAAIGQIHFSPNKLCPDEKFLWCFPPVCSSLKRPI